MIFRRDSFALIKFATWRKEETFGWEEEDKENGMEAGFKERREKESDMERGKERGGGIKGAKEK